MILILINLSGLEVSLKICAIPTQNLFQLPGPSAIWFLLLPSSLAAWPSVATAVGPLEAAMLRAKEFELGQWDNSSPPMMGVQLGNYIIYNIFGEVKVSLTSCELASQLSNENQFLQFKTAPLSNFI